MGGQHERVQRLKAIIELCKANPNLRMSEIEQRCVLWGLVDKKIDEMVLTLVDAKLLLQIPEYEPFDTYTCKKRIIETRDKEDWSVG